MRSEPRSPCRLRDELPFAHHSPMPTGPASDPRTTALGVPLQPSGFDPCRRSPKQLLVAPGANATRAGARHRALPDAARAAEGAPPLMGSRRRDGI